jgi:hypothetical protein
MTGHWINTTNILEFEMVLPPSKELVLMRDVIVKYHPEFVNSRTLRRIGLEQPSRFNIPFLIEEALAHVGNMQFVDADGYDFLPDYSDSKTVSVNPLRYSLEINSVENKIGALRITAYNPLKGANGSTDFFFVPQKDLQNLKRDCYGVSSHKERLVWSYSKKYNDDYGFMEDYRLKDFEELAMAR